MPSFSRSHDSTLLEEDQTIHVGDATAETCATLYQQFLEGHQKHPLEEPLEEDVWNLVQEYEQVCVDHLNVLEELKSKRSNTVSRFDTPVISDNVLRMLRLERNSWRLIRILSLDRVHDRREDFTEDMEGDVDEGIILSDRQVIDRLYEKSGAIRQLQLIIMWLESNFFEDLQRIEDEDKIEFYSEGPHYWENSLHKAQKESHRSTGTEIALDPDAGFRSPKDVQELDKEDETRLLRFVFRYIRAGQLDTAFELCSKLGYYWLSGILHGWRLHHDPNLDPNPIEEGKRATEGNARRDLFKYVCWAACQSKQMSQYEKAILGCLSGNASASLPVCNTWADKMWSFFKSSLDVQVEQELRVCSAAKPSTARLSGNLVQPTRASVELPADYWSNRKSAEEIFRELEGLLTDYNWSLEEKYHFMVQKFIICNNVQGLLEFMQSMIDPSRQEQLRHDMDFTHGPQMLRFFAHVLLFLRSTGFINDHSGEATKRMYRNVIETYVNYLIDNKQITLVAFYVSKLPKDLQTHCYSRLLKKITDKQERKVCLDIAKRTGLDVDAITKRVVESMRETSHGNILETSCSVLDATVFVGSADGVDPADMQLIQSLEWLSLGQIQFIEFLRQANAFMRTFILSGKLEAAEEVFRRCPSDLTSGVRRAFKKKSGSNELSVELKNWEREYLCFSAFFQARESFSDWMRYYSQSKPRQPIKPATSTRFTDKVAFEHRSKAYELEIQQWKEVLKRQAKTTADKLYSVILFPEGGWMRDSSSTGVSRREEGVTRTQELAALRKRFIPQLTLLLHRVLFNSGLFAECIEICKVIASDDSELHAEFTSEQLEDLLQRIAEASISCLNSGLDAFGSENH